MGLRVTGAILMRTGGYMIERLGHSLLETVGKVPEVGDGWGNKVIVAVYEIYPLVYEVELDDFSTYIVGVV